MSNYTFDNTYGLSEEQLKQLDQAEEMMVRMDLGNCEKLLLSMLMKMMNASQFCVIWDFCMEGTCPNLKQRLNILRRYWFLSPITLGLGIVEDVT